MKTRSTILAIVCVLWFLSSGMTRADESADQAARSARDASDATAFTISIDEAMQAKWGFRYPVTYVFRVAGATGDSDVLRRDEASGEWVALDKRSSDEFLNGVECVRFNPAENRAYVSVGFGEGHTIELEFAGVDSAAFDSVARYYDNRKAAYTLSNDNWGRRASSNPGAPWKGMTDDASDSYQASVHACRKYRLPVSIAINSHMYGGDAIWQRIQEELDRGDRSWEPAVHSSTHPCSAKAYAVHGYESEIIGCRDEILKRLANIPYGQHLFEFILPCGYKDRSIEEASQGEFLLLRDWNGRDNPASTDYIPWNAQYRYYGIGAIQTKSYDAVLEKRNPKGRYYAADVAALNGAFDAVYGRGGIFYAMWHADRYRNSVIYDVRLGVDGVQGSTLMQHFDHVSGRPDVWYVANGWLYSYRYVAENAKVSRQPASRVGERRASALPGA
jgi:hypothetical protein